MFGDFDDGGQGGEEEGGFAVGVCGGAPSVCLLGRGLFVVKDFGWEEFSVNRSRGTILSRSIDSVSAARKT